MECLVVGNRVTTHHFRRRTASSPKLTTSWTSSHHLRTRLKALVHSAALLQRSSLPTKNRIPWTSSTFKDPWLLRPNMLSKDKVHNRWHRTITLFIILSSNSSSSNNNQQWLRLQSYLSSHIHNWRHNTVTTLRKCVRIMRNWWSWFLKKRRSSSTVIANTSTM